MAAQLDEPLSKRELDVLQTLGDGASNKLIAEKLFISPNTVKVHVRNIRTKLGATSRTDIVTKAIERQLLVRFATVEVAAPSVQPSAPPPVAPTPTPEQPPSTPSPAAPTLEQPTSTRTVPPVAPATIVTPSSANLTNAVVEPDAGTMPSGAVAQPRRTSLLIIAGCLFVVGVLMLGWFLPQINAAITSNNQPFIEEQIDEFGWYTTRPLADATSRHALTSIGLNLYLIGGETESGISNQTLRYNTAEKVWEALTAKPTATSDMTSVVIQGQIYVVGGRLKDNGFTNRLEVYSPTSDAWRPAAALPIAAAGGVTLVNNDLLYYIGGETEAGASAQAFVYSPATDGWRPVPPLNTARSHAIGGILDNRIIVAGGINAQNELKSCEQFDLTTEAWSPCADMLSARAGASANAIFSELHVLGGGINEAVSHGEVYDSDKDEWRLLNMPIVGSGQGYLYFGTAPVETNIYIVGGERDGEKQAASFIYKTLPFQFFVPSAPNN